MPPVGWFDSASRFPVSISVWETHSKWLLIGMLISLMVVRGRGGLPYGVRGKGRGDPDKKKGPTLWGEREEGPSARGPETYIGALCIGALYIGAICI